MPNLNVHGREFKVSSKDELIKLIAEWENSDDATLKGMSEALKKSIDKLGDNGNMTIKIVTD